MLVEGVKKFTNRNEKIFSLLFGISLRVSQSALDTRLSEHQRTQDVLTAHALLHMTSLQQYNWRCRF